MKTIQEKAEAWAERNMSSYYRLYNGEYILKAYIAGDRNGYRRGKVKHDDRN